MVSSLHALSATTEAEPALRFVSIGARGTGCPTGSWTTSIADDGQLFTTTFSAYEVSVDPATRNIFDLSAIPLVHKLSHLPIIADPSHGVGLREHVPAMARASLAAGADGLIIEVHPNPDRALSDGAQTLNPDQFAKLMQELGTIASAIGRSMAGTAARAVG